MKHFKKWIYILSVILITLACAAPAAASESMLPDGLIITDSNGIQADPMTGEFFVVIEGMVPGTHYKKNIGIQSFRADKAFDLYMRAEPVSTNGTIDLFKEVTLKLELDGKEIYTGSPNGLGNINMQKTALKLGNYTPGHQSVLTMTATLNGENLDGKYHSEALFKWIFYASVDEEYKPPKTGETVRNMMYFLIGTVFILIVMTLLLYWKKRKDSSHFEL